MFTAFTIHPWKLTEDALPAGHMRLSESLTSLGNGLLGMRGNFEEQYSGDSHQGTYFAGVWFPDKTRVGWWKNGYPAYFGKVINAMNLTSIRVVVDDVEFDLGQLPVRAFERTLDMQTGTLSRRCVAAFPQGDVLLETQRFLSVATPEVLAIRLSVTPQFEAAISLLPALDADVRNEDSNYDEMFWDFEGEGEQGEVLWVKAKTKENPFGTPRFAVAAAMHNTVAGAVPLPSSIRSGYACRLYAGKALPGETVTIDKIVAVATSRDEPEKSLGVAAVRRLLTAAKKGFDILKEEHDQAWAERWRHADVRIDGDPAAQQGIRFNIFQLFSTYYGEDKRLNIGPKGFTGEKYGGATYWDTEAYCLPLYTAIAGQQVARNLLLYRFLQLDGAFYNARQQGLKGALYPMVTFTGVECHNEWEITFEEIHRNAAIAMAIFQYVEYTGDTAYLAEHGLDVLTAIARFWADRAHFSKRNHCYMIHGVTGPNEYENNVNNNWYTNRMAKWCLDYTAEQLQRATPKKRAALSVEDAEIAAMRTIAEGMYLPEDAELGIFVQHDTFLDKDLMPADDLPPEDRPINQHWSWDRILRSCFIKQADTLQGLYALGHLYDLETKRRNFDFYEPMTVHESSLSPCVHAVLAAELGYHKKAVEMYHRTARLDLDNINRDTQDGLHITSMSGSWLAIAQGFAGMRTVGGLSFRPFLPEDWQGYAFSINYRGRLLEISVTGQEVQLSLQEGDPLTLKLYDESVELTNTHRAPLSFAFAYPHTSD